MASNLNLIACISVCWFLLAVVIQLDSSWQSQTVYKDSYNWLSHTWIQCNSCRAAYQCRNVSFDFSTPASQLESYLGVVAMELRATLLSHFLVCIFLLLECRANTPDNNLAQGGKYQFNNVCCATELDALASQQGCPILASMVVPFQHGCQHGCISTKTLRLECLLKHWKWVESYVSIDTEAVLWVYYIQERHNLDNTIVQHKRPGEFIIGL